MNSKDIVTQKKALVRKQQPDHPILSLQDDMNKLFENFWNGLNTFESPPWERGLATYNPRVDITDGSKTIRLTAELPGMDEKDIEVTLTQDLLMIKGQKSQETEDKGKNYYRMERSYGGFERAIRLPAGVDAGKAEAIFKKGVLTVTLPKTGGPKQDMRKIAVKAQ